MGVYIDILLRPSGTSSKGGYDVVFLWKRFQENFIDPPIYVI